MAVQIVQTEAGLIRGARGGDPAISVFRGVPYAAPPIGARRWKPPQPVAPWQGVRDAIEFQPIPAQVEETHPFYSKEFYQFRHPMNEDCLYLNIWTPAESEDARLPVLFFIHGGGFKSGYSHEITMDGEGFARKGVLLVTIEYRLGSLGYLAHAALCAESPRGVSGNYGLLDQIAALRWVQRNIAAFGGNPDNITIFGQSAGAMSVENLITSPLSRDRISKAIMQSAGGYGIPELMVLPMLTMQEAARVGADFWTFLGAPSLGAARAVPAEALVQRERAFIETRDSQFAFGPVIDGCAQPMHPYEAVRCGEFANIPYLLGSCTNENGPNTVLPRPDTDAYAAQIRKKMGADAEEFLNRIGLSQNPLAAIDGGGFNDTILPCALAWCEHMAAIRHEKPSYLYSFDRALPGDETGAFHSAELWYVFQTLGRSWRPMTGADFELADIISSYWSNFAKTGDPNGEGLPRWEPYRNRRQAMRLGIQTGMSAEFASARTWFIVDKVIRDMDTSQLS